MKYFYCLLLLFCYVSIVFILHLLSFVELLACFVSYVVVVLVVVVFYFILSRLLYLAFSANLGLLCMPHPGMGTLVYRPFRRTAE